MKRKIEERNEEKNILEKRGNVNKKKERRNKRKKKRKKKGTSKYGREEIK